MNDINYELFSVRLGDVKLLLNEKKEVSIEKKGEIQAICSQCFQQLQHDADEIKNHVSDSNYPISKKVSELSLYIDHLNSVKELIKINLSDRTLFPIELTSVNLIESLDLRANQYFEEMIKATENWEQQFEQIVDNRLQKQVSEDFKKLIAIASEQARKDIIPTLTKRCDFIMSKYLPHHILRDELVDKQFYAESEYLFNLINRFALKNMPLGEDLFKTVQALRSVGLSLTDLEPMIQNLEGACYRGIFFCGVSHAELEKASVTAMHNDLQFIESLRFIHLITLSENLDLAKRKAFAETKVQLLKATIINRPSPLIAPLLKEINQAIQESSSFLKLYEEIFFSKMKETSEIKQFLNSKTGNNDLFFSIYQEPWNISSWSENFALQNTQHLEKLFPFLNRFSKKSAKLAETIDALPTQAKEDFYQLFHTLYKSKNQSSDFWNHSLQLINKCQNLEQLKGLKNIICEDVTQVEFLITLPERLLLKMLESAKQKNSEILEITKLISKMEFYFQVYFITLFSKQSLKDDLGALTLYKENPSLLKKLIDLETTTQTSVLHWLKQPSLINVDYFKNNTHILKMFLKKTIKFKFQENKESEHIEILLKKGKAEWIEKTYLLIESNKEYNRNFFSNCIEYLALNDTLDSAITTLFSQDMAVFKRYPKEFAELAKELMEPLFIKKARPQKIDKNLLLAIEKLLTYALQKQGPLFEKMMALFSKKESEKIVNFFTHIEKLENSEAKTKLLFLAEESVDLVNLYIAHPLTESIDTLSTNEVFEKILKSYPLKIQNKVKAILFSWEEQNGNHPFSKLKIIEVAFFSRLLQIADKNESVFNILANCSCQFPLPGGEKLLSLANLDQNTLVNFEKFVMQYPERGYWTLKYATRSDLDALDLLIYFDPNDERLGKCFKTRDPIDALDKLTQSLKDFRDRSQRPVIRPKKTFMIPELKPSQDTNSFNKIEALLPVASAEEKLYLQQLCILEIQRPDSPFVSSLLSQYPIKNVTLPMLALEGYYEEAYALLKRVQKDVPLSPFTEKLLAHATPVYGKWLSAALKLDSKSENAIQMISRAEKITELEMNITYLAAAEQYETLNAVFKALKEPSSTSKVLIEWVLQGDLSFVKWVCHQDIRNLETLYKQIRDTPNQDVQKAELLLYRNLAHLPHIQKTSLEWILQSENQEQRIANILYFQAHDPKTFAQIAEANDFNTVEKRVADLNPLVKINQSLEAIAHDPALSIEEKALKAQFQFAVEASDMLINHDGSINKYFIKELKKSDFFLENQAKKTTVYNYLRWVFTLLETQSEFSERLAQHAVIPNKGSPAYILIKKTLRKQEFEVLTLREVQVALLSCLLQRPWQSPFVGSCFGTSIVIQRQSTENGLMQTLDEYLILVRENGLTRKVENITKQYPLSYREEEGLVEHPFAKAREYCISSMASSGQGQMLRLQSMDVVFSDNNGVMPKILSSVASQSPEAYIFIDSLIAKLQKKFLNQTLELYDSLLKDTKSSAEREGQGGWVLGHVDTYELINTQEKYEQFLLNLIEEEVKSQKHPVMQEALALLKEKIINHDLTELVKEKIGEKILPWANSAGGTPHVIIDTYYELHQPSQFLYSALNSFRDDLKMLYTYAHFISSEAAAKNFEERIYLGTTEHAYSLIKNRIASLQKFKTFGEMECSLIEKSQSFGKIQLSQALGETWVEALCSNLSKFSSETSQKLRAYLQRHPIVASSLQDYGWQLTDAVLRVLPSEQEEMVKSIGALVEKAVLNLTELKEQLSYIIIGDYNWFNSKQDAYFAAYAVSPFTEEIEPYSVGEEGRELSSEHRMDYGISIGASISEKPWKTFT